MQTGRLVVRILKGEAPGSIPSERSETVRLFVNPGAAAKQGVTLSADLLAEAAKVIE